MFTENFYELTFHAKNFDRKRFKELVICILPPCFFSCLAKVYNLFYRAMLYHGLWGKFYQTEKARFKLVWKNKIIQMKQNSKVL